MRCKLSFFILIVVFWSCQSTNRQTATPYDYPDPYDTDSKPIELQDKRVYGNEQWGVYADNKFDGARLNDFIQVNDSTFRAVIKPENEPINPSPWYAFRLWSSLDRTIIIQTDYSGRKHRYRPKISQNGNDWALLDSLSIGYSYDSTYVEFKLNVTADTLWLAGQEVVNSSDVKTWCEKAGSVDDVKFSVYGKSKLDRDLFCLDVSGGSEKEKKTIVVFSRQHPPEVTGYFAMQAFIQEVMGESALAQQFRKTFRIMVFPLLNPDGVDLGHWRHNAGGVDLNRDWAYYKQPEIRQTADFIVNETSKANNDVILGLDFHSTYFDVFYTNKNASSTIEKFKTDWLKQLENEIPDYSVNEKPSEIKKPVSKSWFYTQFQAEGITYEIGDQTSREFIDIKGSTSAREMMKLLLEKR